MQRDYRGTAETGTINILLLSSTLPMGVKNGAGLEKQSLYTSKGIIEGINSKFKSMSSI
jgi:hypothetical protein